ncbi:MAG: hypothetical protein FWH23_06865, partial [Bacteroidales bacterium]|nr:hypothetical protein [Bacteroidales bacterium]
MKNTLPVPEIKDGIAKLSGTITNFHLVGREDNPTLILRVPHPVTAEAYVARTTVDEDGAFSVEVPMQCNYAVGYFRPEKMYNGFYVCLTAGKEAKMDIMCEKTGLFRITNQTDSLGLTAIDLINMEMVSDELMNYRPPKKTTASTKMPDEFAQRRKIILNYQLKILAESDSLLGAPSLSEIAKDFVVNNTKVLTLDWYYFDYRRSVRDENFNPPIPDKQYYTFLKDFDLNNPQYLYRGYFNVLQRILSDETLNIPLIGDRPVEQWMKEVRKILSKLVGFNKGLFYD